MDTAMLMAMATLTRASGMGIPMVMITDIHMRICTMATAMAIPMKASTTKDMDVTMNIMEAMGNLELQASSTTWTLSHSDRKSVV